MTIREHSPTPPQEPIDYDRGEPREEQREDAERIRELIASGEAMDEMDAREVPRELSYIEFLRTADRAKQIALIEQEFNDPQTEGANRYDLMFPLAVLETGETPDEIEFLWWNALCDMRTENPQNEADARRRASANARAERQMQRPANAIGEKRAEELFSRYRERLQKMHEAYDDIHNGR